MVHKVLLFVEPGVVLKVGIESSSEMISRVLHQSKLKETYRKSIVSTLQKASKFCWKFLLLFHSEHGSHV